MKDARIFVGKKVETITGKMGKIIWVRDQLIHGLPLVIVEFDNGQRQDYTSGQFEKVFI